MVNTITEMYLVTTNGNKYMLKKIKRVFDLLRLELHQFKMKHVENLKTGISPFERQRINNLPKLKAGIATIFEKPFHYSDKDGFLHSLDEIFEQETYKFFSEKESPLIIDCGANIGLSTYYFIRQFPNSKIIAFEPDKEIFKLLENNVKSFPNHQNIEIHNTAVWTEDTQLKFYSEGSLAGSLSLDVAKKNNYDTVEAVDLKKYLQNEVDFLKIDIEGAENTLIFDIKNSLKNVKLLFLEYHGIVNQPQNLGDILNLLHNAGFEYYIRLAADTLNFPFCNEKNTTFNQQLNIFCYRNI